MTYESVVFPALSAFSLLEANAMRLPATEKKPPGVLYRVRATVIVQFILLIFFFRPGSKINPPGQFISMFTEHIEQIDNVPIQIIQNLVRSLLFIEKHGRGTAVWFKVVRMLWKV